MSKKAKLRLAAMPTLAVALAFVVNQPAQGGYCIYFPCPQCYCGYTVYNGSGICASDPNPNGWPGPIYPDAVCHS